MKIKLIDHVHCQTDDIKTLSKYLKTSKTVYRKGLWGSREKITKTIPLVDEKGLFFTGFLPRIKKICSTRNIPLVLEGELEMLPNKGLPEYELVTLFPDQKGPVKNAIEIQRGYIKAPTGTGKTIITYAIIQAFMPCKALIICPSASITLQTAKKLKEEFRMNVTTITAGKANLEGDVVVGIVNSINNLKPEQYCSLFDVIIVDEKHHINLEGMYANILTKSIAPVRIGLTATPDPPDSEKGMASEGLLGPLIGKFEMKDAIEQKRIAKPTLKLVPVPINGNIKELRTWREIYDVGIVFNRMRNKIIAKQVLELNNNNKNCIVFVKTINHIDTLYNAISQEKIPCKYVAGEVSPKDREIIKNQLETKQTMCVIATAAWREGVDIPHLDAVINAAGYLSEKAVLQMAGRALRSADGKENGFIIDFLDSGKYLSEHCVRRLLIYAEMGWL